MSFGWSGNDNHKTNNDKTSQAKTSAAPTSTALTSTARTFSQGLMTSQGSASGTVEAFLSKGTKVSGTITFGGAAEIHGDVEGEILAKEKIIIGDGANIKAKIVGTEIVVSETVYGDIIASKVLSLKRNARVVGNIQAAVLSIEEGVVFDGKCTMSNSAVSNSIASASSKSGEPKLQVQDGGSTAVSNA